MPEFPRNIEFHHVPNGRHDFEYRPYDGLTDKFEYNKDVKAKDIKNYVQEIIKQVNENSNLVDKRACIMDLLRDESIKALLKNRQEESEGEETDADKKSKQEVEEMVFYWTKRIKRQIIDELKKYLPEDLYFFVAEKQKTKYGHFNKTRTIEDINTNEKYFLKESDANSREIKNARRKCLTTINKAIADLEKVGKEMPYIITPRMIGQTRDIDLHSSKSLSYASKYEDITAIEDTLIEEVGKSEHDYKELDENDAIKSISAILDCLRGAKFLASLNLSLTDLNTYPIGKNFGINNKNKKGVIFDLDGLQEVGQTMTFLIAPKGDDGMPMFDSLSPEYRDFHKKPTTVISESMIWEIGDSIYRLSDIQLMISLESRNLYKNPDLNSFWFKLKDFSDKMVADKPEDRPPFDICIIKIEEIIKKLAEKK
ncbi:MAG: hypothetical protein ACD_72C00415G0002 [uncultured bacterium]|nr:MAG: hypothetical protein ACD_72C00415G0002 [uncultured bacterium]